MCVLLNMKIPYINVSSGKIEGCEEGSYKWFHEKGHLEFDKLFGGMILINDYIKSLWAIFLTISFVYSPLFSFAVVCMAFNIIFFWFEEYWCNQYAKHKHLNTKTN